jgi:hypothetical protein
MGAHVTVYRTIFGRKKVFSSQIRTDEGCDERG